MLSTLAAIEASFTRVSRLLKNLRTPLSVRASILLTPAATPDSDTILKSLMLAVLATCVPPQNSLEKSPIHTTLTFSPYFSPKSAIAPVFLASSIVIIFVSTGIASAIFSLTISSTFLISSSVILWKCVKSNLNLSGST